MIILVDPKRGFVTRVQQQLGHANGIVHAERLGELDRLVRDHAEELDAVLLGPNTDPEEGLDAVRRLGDTASTLGIVLAANEVTPDLLQTAMRLGFRDVLQHPFTSEQLMEALERAQEHTEHFRGLTGAVGTEQATTDHQLVTVFSTKGGCGKSVVASNLAALLADRTGQEVALIDLDLQSGDLAIMLQLLPAWTISDAVENIERLDGEALRGYMTEHRGGFKLLPAPVDPSHGELVTEKAVHRILHIAREEFPYVIVDTPPLFTDAVLASLDESDVCVLVTSMDVPSIKNLKLALQTLQKLGLSRDRIQLVLNRADSNVGLRIQEVEKSIGTDIDVSLPSTRDVPLSVNQGVPLAISKKKSSVIQPLTDLVDTITNRKPTEEEPRERRGLFGRR